MADSSPLLLTVGHSTLSFPEFLGLLRRGLVTELVDVRRHPGSKRSPQFAATELAGALAASGIGYRGMGELLGGRRSAKHAAEAEPPDNSGWQHPSFRAYADYMSTPAFARGLAELEACARERRTAIMCAEAHPSRCHRRLIADAMTVRGWRVHHLLPGRKLEEHGLSEHGVVEGDRLSYPAEGKN